VTRLLVAIILVAVLFGLTAVAGLVWAIRRGQFRNLTAGARSIFDNEEPVGRPTDAFPPPREEE